MCGQVLHPLFHNYLHEYTVFSACLKFFGALIALHSGCYGKYWEDRIGPECQQPNSPAPTGLSRDHVSFKQMRKA